jgi:hypothetical protein
VFVYHTSRNGFASTRKRPVSDLVIEITIMYVYSYFNDYFITFLIKLRMVLQLDKTQILSNFCSSMYRVIINDCPIAVGVGDVVDVPQAS